MARREATTNKGRRNVPAEDKPARVVLPGGRSTMPGGRSIGAPTSPKYVGGETPSSVATLTHMPIKK